MLGTPFPSPRFFAAAPTRDQAKRIYWEDLKSLVTLENMSKPPSESHLVIYLMNKAEIHVLGMDKPERIEGTPWDGGVLDEIGNMKKRAWTEHVRPALSDRRGWCDFIGVPQGRNHYYELDRLAREIMARALREGGIPEWAHYWWASADILPPEEIAAAKRDLDDVTFKQEYEGSFVHYTGMAYHSYEEVSHQSKLKYNPEATLAFCFDFNVAPGVVSVLQQQHLPRPSGIFGSGIIGEVWISKNSNTLKVCDKLIEDWGEHRGRIICYGDSTGGARGTAKVLGSDWQLIKEKLWAHYGSKRVFFKVPLSNPRERDRLNSVNSRLKSIDGRIRLMVDPDRAPHTVRDFEGTMVTEDGSGQIDKKADPDRSHLTDAIGYHIHREWPIKKKYAKSKKKFWK